MTETLDMFAGVVREIANGPKVTSFQDLTESLLRRLSEKGLTLEQCADRRMSNRSVSTLQKHCREYSIRFPDYVPSNMRKHVSFVFQADPQGDCYHYTGPEADVIASLLGVTSRKQDGGRACFFSAHFFDVAKEQLKAAGYVAKIAKPAKKAKVAAHA